MQSPVLIAPLMIAPLPPHSLLLAPCPLLPSALARLWSRGREGGEDEQSSSKGSRVIRIAQDA
jgi:hypothetical protein